jgi:type I restriction enzyme S subunit
MTLDINTVKVDPAQAYDIVGVLNRGRGLLYRDPIAGSKTAYPRLNRIGPNQVVYSRLKAFEGAITVAPANLHEVYASQEFPTFTCGPSLLPDYFRLLTTTKRLWDTLQKLSTGMGGRRERVKPKDFLTIKITQPSLPEQLRIIDAVGAVDAQISALTEEFARAERVLTLLRADVPAGDEHRISDVVVGIDSGKSTQTSGETPSYGEPSVLKLSAIQLGEFDAAEAKRLDDITGYSTAHLVSDGDLLITRSNTPARVGYATVARQVPPHTYLPDLIWRIRPNISRCLPGYLSHLLSSPEWRSRIVSTATGTSASMQKINKRRFGMVMIPVPSLDKQQEYIAKCDAVADPKRSLAGELGRLKGFRSTLLVALLSQDLEILETYDDLLEKVF